MKMRILNISVLILLGVCLFAFILGSAKPCSAQFIPPIPLFPPVNPFLNPFPFVPPLPTFPAPILNPALSLPSLLSPPGLPFARSAAATLIVLPPAAPAVTAYAPLGTLSLTPSTLIFLILYLTLPE